MISRVLNQASKTPRTIETSASTTGIQRTTAEAGYPQYAVLIKGVGVRQITVSRELARPCLWVPRLEAEVYLLT